MFRCILDSSLLQIGEVELPSEEARHLVQVLRAREGDSVELLDGQGQVAKAELIQADKRHARVLIKDLERKEAPSPRVTLVQGLPKNPAMDLIVQKSTELGVQRIQPLLSEYSVVQVKSSDAEKKCQRWSDISKAAMKQSGMAWAPQIAEPQTLTELLPRMLQQNGLSLVADLSPEIPLLRDVLAEHSPAPTELVCWVGPEGGFSPQEMAQLNEAGVRSVSLGSNILRAETAALYLLSVLAYEYGN